MKPEIHKLLLSLDQSNRWEYPVGFKRKKHLQGIKQIKQALEDRLGITSDLDHHVEDASFLADLGILEQRWQKGATVLVYLFFFRFSNFGKLFTLAGELKSETIEKYQLPLLIEWIEQKGFTYIPNEDLEALYDGVNQPYVSGLTWWIRYFDYL